MKTIYVLALELCYTWMQDDTVIRNIAKPSMNHCWCGLQPEDPLRAKHCLGSHLGRMVDVERPRKPNVQIRSISASSTQTKGRLWNITLKIPRDCFKPLIRFGSFRSSRKLLLEPSPCNEKPKDYLWMGLAAELIQIRHVPRKCFV